MIRKTLLVIVGLLIVATIVLWVRSYYVLEAIVFDDGKRIVAVSEFYGIVAVFAASTGGGRPYSGFTYLDRPYQGSWLAQTGGRNFGLARFGPWGTVVSFPHGAICLVLAAWPVCSFLKWAVVRDHRLRRGSCMHCGYDLTGNTSGTCPECGKAASSNAKEET